MNLHAHLVCALTLLLSAASATSATSAASATGAPAPTEDPAHPPWPVLAFEPYCLLVGGPDGHELGRALHAIGDVDGDGITDLAVFSYVHIPELRKPSGPFRVPYSLQSWVRVLSSADLTELWRDHGSLGSAEAAVAVDDLDGDGLNDIAVTCTHIGRGDLLELRSGLTGQRLGVHPSSSFDGGSEHPLALLPDVDGDARADLVVGSYGSTQAFFVGCRRPPRAEYGVLELVSGARTSDVLARRTGGRDFGRDVCLVGDVTGDGLPEIVTLESGFGTEAREGRVMLLAGDDLSTLVERRSVLAWANGRLAPIGDIDGDGIADLVLARLGLQSIHIRERPDPVDILSGATLGVLRSHGQDTPQDTLGYRAANLGDLDGDGVPDYALTNRVFTPLGEAPAAYRSIAEVLSGRTGERLGTLRGLPEHEGWVESLAPLGDVDGDGRPEIALGLSRYTVDGERRGAVLVVSVRVR